MTRILFFSTTNACRSQMAEGFVRARQVAGVTAHSAGAEAAELSPQAVKAMGEVGVDISGQTAKLLQDLGAAEFDIVVTIDAAAGARCPLLPGWPYRVDWNLPDPHAAAGDGEDGQSFLRRSRDEIRRLVDDLFDKGYLAALVTAKRVESTVLNNISDGIIAHDMDRRVLHFNRAAEQITGYSRSEIINRDCHEGFPGNFCGGKCLFTDGGLPGFDEAQRELQITTKNGETRLLDTAVKAMRDAAGEAVGVIVSFRDRTREKTLARRVGEMQQFSGIIGRDEKMLGVFDMIRDLANTNVPVIVQGESGTGKELVAAAIHNEGPRASGLFVPVNCGALPETLLESELFGHVRGAFTGAIRDKKGRFELADGGTIFLDEIGDISPAMQVKLMRVLQEGTFERVGSERTLKVDVRVISATNKDLSEEIASGRFREDLYYRLSVVPLWLPALRERRNDIPLLAEHVLGRALEAAGRTGVEISQDAMGVLMSYDWPGNVRELQNWLQFALVKCKAPVILPEHLPPVRRGVVVAPRRRGRRKLDVTAVNAALEKARGNKVEAARELGVSRATLYRFLSDSGL